MLALLTAFALAAVILGSLAPVTFFLAWNAPPPGTAGAASAHSAYLVTHTLLTGFAGLAANLHLDRLLAVEAPTPAAATNHPEPNSFGADPDYHEWRLELL